VATGGVKGDRAASRAFLAYNVSRLGLFVVCFGIGWLAGLRPVIVVIVVALLVSGALSWFLLRRQREAMGLAVEQTVERSRVRMAERAAAEDDYQPTP
jgi:CHASE2 domain-containing sensor protein